jgi:general secretion pathway protein G
MKSYRKSIRKGFTLVEILIVVIILGILAAIVIPQFTNASSDARQSSMTSQLQTIRSQLELYKLQHGDLYPTTDGKCTAATFTNWDRLTGKTDADGTINANGAYGPYLQQPPTNPLTNSSTVSDTASKTVGFVFEDATGKIYGVDKDGNKDTVD